MEGYRPQARGVVSSLGWRVGAPDADPRLCQQMGANARALAEGEFAREILADRLEQVLVRAVDPR